MTKLTRRRLTWHTSIVLARSAIELLAVLVRPQPCPEAGQDAGLGEGRVRKGVAEVVTSAAAPKHGPFRVNAIHCDLTAATSG